MNLKVKAASARPPLCELPVGVAELRSQNLDHGSCFCVCVYEHLLWCYLTWCNAGFHITLYVLISGRQTEDTRQVYSCV